MTDRQLVDVDALTADESVHLVAAIGSYRRAAQRDGLSVPAVLAEIQRQCAERALSGDDRRRQVAPSLVALAVALQPQPVTPSTLMTTEEVANHMRCSPRTIQRRIADGTLPAVRNGRLTRIRRVDLDAHLAAAAGDDTC